MSIYSNVLLISTLKFDNLPANVSCFKEIDKLNQLKSKMKGSDLVILDTDNISHSVSNIVKSSKINYLYLNNVKVS